jgi:hypothetical protein
MLLEGRSSPFRTCVAASWRQARASASVEKVFLIFRFERRS